jgi:hypothetical protein
MVLYQFIIDKKNHNLPAQSCNSLSPNSNSDPQSQVAHMKKEIDAIRAKDISQGGLTQGQQTQIARNELGITQVSSCLYCFQDMSVE